MDTKRVFHPENYLYAAWWLVAVATIGCRADGPELYPVAGKITLDGQPLPQVGISFRPDEAQGNTSGHIPTGVADAAGKFALETVGAKGAPPGWYKVVVTPYSPGPVEVPPPPYHTKFLNVATTDLTLEVKKGAPPGSYDLQLSK